MRDADLDGLADDDVHRHALGQGLGEADPGSRFGACGAVQDFDDGFFRIDSFDAGREFQARAVEEQKRIAGLQAQDRPDVMGVVPREFAPLSRPKARSGQDARRGHRPFSPFFRT